MAGNCAKEQTIMLFETDIIKEKRCQRCESLYVDHCHDTMKVRALLCQFCNQGIGQFKENVSILESAIEYLKIHKP